MFSMNYIIFVGLCFNFETTGSFRTNFHIKHFEFCNETQGLIHFQGNITEENNKYYLSYDITTPIAMDENVGARFKIDTKLGEDYVELFVIREKYACKAANIYGGEFWYDIERAAQWIPGQCPVQPGRYHVHHVLLDFQKISLQTFPFGRLRFTIGLVDNANPQGYLLCLFTEVENVLN